MASRRVDSRSDYYNTKSIYVDGNTVRKPAETIRPEKRSNQRRRKVSRQATQNRTKALQMGRGYVLFLTAVSVATLFMCVHFIQLRSTVTSQLKEVASLESELNQLTAENDALYDKTISDIDLEHVRDVAINDLGMDYATEDQVIWYSSNTTNSYVRQYQDVPTE